jgi:hypothetical protein
MTAALAAYGLGWHVYPGGDVAVLQTHARTVSNRAA